jgi:membrane protein YdbS with pleckstrin-like domain
MSLWWIPAGIAAWFLVAVVVALCIGPVLGRRSQAREAVGPQWTRVPEGMGVPEGMRVPEARQPVWKDRPVAPGWLTAGSGIARREQNVTL